MTVPTYYEPADGSKLTRQIYENEEWHSYSIWDATYSPFGIADDYASGDASVGIDIGDPDTTGINWLPPFRFPGQYYDYKYLSGYNLPMLYYNHYRFYMPELGRYTSADPMKQHVISNIYNYANNNPFISVDPNGLDYLLFQRYAPGEGDIHTGTLYWYDDNGNIIAIASAISGGNGISDPAPNGEYFVTIGSIGGTNSFKKAFCDPNGVCYFFPFFPENDENNPKCPCKGCEGKRCGLHPDGPPLGTHGCIGLEQNTGLFLSLLYNYFYLLHNQSLPLIILSDELMTMPGSNWGLSLDPGPMKDSQR